MELLSLTQVDLTRKILRVEMNDGWYPTELASVLFWTNSLYNLRLLTYVLDVELGQSNFPYYVISNNYVRENNASKRNLGAIIDNYFHQQKLKSLNIEAVNAIVQRFKREYRFEIKRINYNSPGSFDGLGIGKLVEEAKDLFLKNKQLNFEKQKYNDEKLNREIKKHREIEELEDLITSNEHKKRMQELEEIEKIEKIRAEKLKNIDNYIQLGQKLGIPDEQLRMQVYKGLNEILKLEDNGKIDSISVVDEDE